MLRALHAGLPVKQNVFAALNHQRSLPAVLSPPTVRPSRGHCAQNPPTAAPHGRFSRP